MIYTLHTKPGANRSGDASFDGLAAIPESTAKWALIAPPIWLIWHRLWWALTVYGFIAVGVLAALATPYAIPALYLGGIPGLYLLFEGHQLRRAKLERLGYELVDVVDAPDERAALERYLFDLPQDNSAVPVPEFPAGRKKSSSRDDLAFGMFAENI